MKKLKKTAQIAVMTTGYTSTFGMIHTQVGIYA